MIKKLILVIVGICVLLLLIFACSIKFNNNSNENLKLDILGNVQNITNREYLYSDGVICFGNNIKELENGYYDIKVQHLQDRMKFYINCLSKNLLNGNFDEDYCLEFCNYVLNIFYNKIDIDRLYESIKSSYLSLRQNRDTKIEGSEYIDGTYHIYIYESVGEICLEIVKLL